jgi:hypothetical protein
MTVACAQPMQPSVLDARGPAPHADRARARARAAVASLINRGYEQRGDLVEEIVEEMPLDASAIETAAGAVGRRPTCSPWRGRRRSSAS